MQAGIIYIECDSDKQRKLTNNYKSIASLTGADNLIFMFKRPQSLREFLVVKPADKFLVVSDRPVEEMECLKNGSLAELPLFIYDTLKGTVYDNYENTIKQIKAMGYLAKWYNKPELFASLGIESFKGAKAL